MPKGFKDFNDANEIARLGESAHPVLKVARTGFHKTTEWYTKDLESAQEAQIECMTGEIYRYLIGPPQPKIRVQSANIVASESVNFLSFRNLIEKPAERQYYNTFQKAFCEHIEGFMMVVLSSVFFEENDLSDNNYGLAFDPAQNPRTFIGFVKIDHGQSFNTLRIQEEMRLAANHSNPKTKIKKQLLGKAEIKYFPPIIPRPIKDLRVKSERSTIGTLGMTWWDHRKYQLTHAFFDRIVMDFVDGCVTKDYISKLTNQPSASPFYDARLLPLIDYLGEEKYEKMEMAKYWALAKIAFTSEAAYLHIAQNATDTSQVPLFWNRVKAKICENRNTLIAELSKDPDFLRFCNVFDYYIKERIRASWEVMLYKRRGTNIPSERYGGSRGATIDPVDHNALAVAANMGAEYQKGDIIPRTRNLLEGFMDFVMSRNWEVGLFGGTTIKFDGRSKKVPGHVAHLMNLLDLYSKCGHRVMRAVHDFVEAIVEANKSSSKSRKESTSQAYFALLTQVNQYARDLRRAGMTTQAAGILHPKLPLLMGDQPVTDFAAFLR